MQDPILITSDNIESLYNQYVAYFVKTGAITIDGQGNIAPNNISPYPQKSINRDRSGSGSSSDDEQAPLINANDNELVNLININIASLEVENNLQIYSVHSYDADILASFYNPADQTYIDKYLEVHPSASEDQVKQQFQFKKNGDGRWKLKEIVFAGIPFAEVKAEGGEGYRGSERNAAEDAAIQEFFKHYDETSTHSRLQTWLYRILKARNALQAFKLNLSKLNPQNAEENAMAGFAVVQALKELKECLAQEENARKEFYHQEWTYCADSATREAIKATVTKTQSDKDFYHDFNRANVVIGNKCYPQQTTMQQAFEAAFRSLDVNENIINYIMKNAHQVPQMGGFLFSDNRFIAKNFQDAGRANSIGGGPASIKVTKQADGSVNIRVISDISSFTEINQDTGTAKIIKRNTGPEKKDVGPGPILTLDTTYNISGNSPKNVKHTVVASRITSHDARITPELMGLTTQKVSTDKQRNYAAESELSQLATRNSTQLSLSNRAGIFLKNNWWKIAMGAVIGAGVVAAVIFLGPLAAPVIGGAILTAKIAVGGTAAVVAVGVTAGAVAGGGAGTAIAAATSSTPKNRVSYELREVVKKDESTYAALGHTTLPPGDSGAQHTHASEKTADSNNVVSAQAAPTGQAITSATVDNNLDSSTDYKPVRAAH